tara:strand:+ start:3172 stop:4089 length:918 start_codon:yes stop_codon:yes gene_type:complete
MKERIIMSKFIMNQKDWDTIQNYSRYAYDEHKSEIGGYMLVKEIDNKFVFTDPVILEQEITASNTEITADAVSDYTVKMEVQHGKEEYWLCWWHSHHTMDVFWSPTDHTAINQHKTITGKYTFNLVINLKGEHILRVCDWRTGTQTDLQMKIGDTTEIPDYIINEVEEKCSKPKPITYRYQTTKTNNTFNHMYSGGYVNQMNIWASDTTDEERVDLEAKLDTILQDYLNDSDYPKYRKAVANLNRKLGRDKSELRVLMVDKEQLMQCVHLLMADEYIYAKGSDKPDIQTSIDFEKSFDITKGEVK